MNHGVIEKVALLVFLGFDTEFISRSINVQSKIFRGWKREGIASEMGICRDLVDAIEAAEDKRFEAIESCIVPPDDKDFTDNPEKFQLDKLVSEVKNKKPDHRDPAFLLGKIYKAHILYHLLIVCCC